MTSQPPRERLQGVRVAASLATSNDDASSARAPRKCWGLKIEIFLATTGGLEHFRYCASQPAVTRVAGPNRARMVVPGRADEFPLSTQLGRSRLSGAGSASAWQSGHPYRGQSQATKLPARREAAPHLQSVYEMSADAPGLRPGPEQRALSGCHARRQRPAGERTILRTCPTDGLNSIDKDSLKIRELEHVLIRKSRATFPGHALDHDGFGLNQSKS